VSLEPGLHDGADIHDRRVAGDERLGRQLAASKEDQLRVQAVFFEQAGFLGDPDMDLIVGDRGIADLDPFELLALDGSKRQEQPNSCNGEKVAR
jgi:hypothetical protein